MKRPKIFFSVGEQSGDLIASGLIREFGSTIKSFGVCGPSMVAAGCEKIDDMASFQAFGISEVISKIPKIAGRFSQLLAEVERIRPDVAVLVDAPGMHFQLAGRLKRLGIPVVQLVAPKLWAWGASRVLRLKNDFAKVLGILPFEKEFFQSRGVNYEYVGCPVVDRVQAAKGRVSMSAQEHGSHYQRHVAHQWHAALPGSRMSEWKFFIPFFVRLLQKNASKNIRWFVPVSENFSWDVLERTFKKSLQDLAAIDFDHTSFKPSCFEQLACVGPVSFVKGHSLEVMAMAEACLVSSGTVALESALLQKKTVVVYKLDSFSYSIAKRLVNIPYVSLPNLALNKPLLDEHLQELSVEAVSDSLFAKPMDAEGYKSLVECFTPMDYAKCRKQVFELI